MATISSFDPKPWMTFYSAPQPGVRATSAGKASPEVSESTSGPASLSFTPDKQKAVADDAAPRLFSWNADGGAGRKKRHAESPDSLDARAAGDSQLAKVYARALATRYYQTSIRAPDVLVPPESTLGRWRTQLDKAFNGPGFLAWAKEHGLDTTNLKLNPVRGELTGSVDGKIQTFSLGDNSGWSDVSRTLLSSAKALVSKHGPELSYPWPQGKVPLSTVGRFYGKPIDLSPAQAAQHRKKLQEGASFEFAPVAHASLRSVEALAAQEEALGDDVNIHAFITALKSQVNDASGKFDLSKLMVSIDPRSAYFKVQDEPLGEVSAAQLISDYDLNLPKTGAEIRNLINTQSFDLAHKAPQADKGGVLPLTRTLEATTLGDDVQAQVRQIVGQWKARPTTVAPQLQDGPGDDSLLGRLVSHLPQSTRKAIADNPAAALDEIIRSPQAKALGKEIQVKLNGVETPTSALEYLSAALVLDLDSTGGASRHNLAGYNLYGEGNVGAPPAEITKRFVSHLEAKVGTEKAPIAARLLLSVCAPELLATGIPSNLVYGSHTWVNYSIEALRIEKQVPGAVANMTYNQVMAFGQTQPISPEGCAQLKEVRRRPVIDWGIANEIIGASADNVYTTKQYNLSVTAIHKQQKELGWASAVLKSSPISRKDMALAELKRVFKGDVDFEKKCLGYNFPSWPDDPRYSLLDLYMSGDLNRGVWEPRGEKALPFDTMAREFHKLNPDISSAFDGEFEKYKAKHEAAFNILFRYHASLMPAEDRKKIDNSDVNFYAVRKTYDGDNYVKIGDKEIYHPGRKPSPEDVEKLTGRHGLLMQADQGNGVIHYYSYFPGQAKIVKEPGLSQPLVSRPQKPWLGSNSFSPNPLGIGTAHFPRNDLGDVLKIDDGPYHAKPPRKNRSISRILVTQLGLPNKDRLSAHVPAGNAEGMRGTYFSERSRTLGVTVSDHFVHGFDSIKKEAKGVAPREQEEINNQKLNRLFLSLVPFYDGIKSAINGDVTGAVFDLGFDAFGFLIPGLNAAKKTLKGGGSIFKAIGSGAFKGVSSSLSFDDILKAPKHLGDGLKALRRESNNGASIGELAWSRINKNYDPKRVYKQNDVVSNFYQKHVGGDGDMNPVTAIFLNGGWYAYNVVTKTPHGVQLAQYAVVGALTE